MRSNRKHERFIRRLETEFSSGKHAFRGISSDLSYSGMFIRSKNPFAPGTVIDITIHLPDSIDCKLKGRVIRAFKAELTGLKSGMGVELIEKDEHYVNFVRSHSMAVPEDEPVNVSREAPKQAPPPQSSQPEYSIIACPSCGVKNKMPAAKVSLAPKCGKCGSPLVLNMP